MPLFLYFLLLCLLIIKLQIFPYTCNIIVHLLSLAYKQHKKYAKERSLEKKHSSENKLFKSLNVTVLGKTHIVRTEKNKI